MVNFGKNPWKTYVALRKKKIDLARKNFIEVVAHFSPEERKKALEELTAEVEAKAKEYNKIAAEKKEEL